MTDKPRSLRRTSKFKSQPSSATRTEIHYLIAKRKGKTSLAYETNKNLILVQLNQY